MLIILLSNLVYFPAAALCFFPMKNQMRLSRLKTVLLIVLVLSIIILAAVWLEYRFGLGENDLILPVFALLFLTYHRVLKVHISKALAVFCVAIAILSILSNLSFCFGALLRQQSRAGTYSLASVLFQLGFSTLAALLLARPFTKYGSVLVDRVDMPRVWYLTIPFSASMFGLNMLLLPVLDAIYDDRRLVTYAFLGLLLLLLLWLLMHLIFYAAVHTLLTSAEMETRNRFLEMQEFQFNSQQRYIKASEKVRHDIRQSVRAMQELYDAGEYEALGRYLHEFGDAMPNREIVSYTDHLALNALLNYYLNVAAQNGIAYSVEVRLPERLPVSDVDLCNMIGNILENALIACARAEKKDIRLAVVTENDLQLYIVAVNSFNGHVRMKDGRYLSTNRKGNGIGLSSIASCAESYGGVAKFSHEGSLFFSNVAIPLKKDASNPGSAEKA